jgi:hypothetical protein
LPEVIVIRHGSICGIFIIVTLVLDRGYDPCHPPDILLLEFYCDGAG